MTSDWTLHVEPWRLRETGFDLGELGRTESLFALSNGHIGVRGTLDEGEPNELVGTYLNGCYESYPLSYAESAYGYPDHGELLINVTNGTVIRLLVDDEPLDVRYGQILESERVLDFRAGTLRRRLVWRSPGGKVVRVTSTRLVSLSQRAIFGIDYVVEAVGADTRVVLQSELVANLELEETSGNPALVEAVMRPLEAEDHTCDVHRSCLVHHTRGSGLRVAAAADHVVDADAAVDVQTRVEPDWSRTTVSATLREGQRLHLTKFVSYGWSARRSARALTDQTDAALSSALSVGWTGMVAEQRDFLDDFWAGADVEVDGDPEVQQAVRFGLFHVLQSSVRAEQRALPAKGLTGTGYSGHAFWDTEMYVLPLLTAIRPRAAADALAWRHRTLPQARERAETLRLKGATLPWRTISGEECGAYWPAGTAAFHINADVAVAASRYVVWTADTDFERDHGLDLLVETARLWLSLGFFGEDGGFHLDGVTGPDEYSALVNDNTFTNVMAARNLRDAATAVRRDPTGADRQTVREDEVESWLRAAEAMAIPYDDHGMPEQYRGATQRQRWDFETTAAKGGYPLQDHYPYVELYRKQVSKQADLVLAMHWCGDRFSTEEKARAFAYAEPLTVRDSSLSAASQAVIAAEVGHLELAHAYVREATLMDLNDLNHNTSDGLHLASLAGGWIALVWGFGGLREQDGRLSLAPRLPPGLRRLTFVLRWRGARLRVEIDQKRARYSVPAEDGTGEPTELSHHGESLVLEAGQSVTREIPGGPDVPEAPSQPPGRAPRAG